MTTTHNNESMGKELLKLLAARQGHFKLESGHHGNLWLDLDLLFLRPGTLQPFASELARNFSSYNPVAICGPLLGGALLAQMIAVELGIGFYYTKQFIPPVCDTLHSVEYQLPDSLRQLIHGKEIVIVDDVISAGSAVRATVAELRSYGANVVGLGALLVLGATAPKFFAGQNLSIETIASLPNDLWTLTECPLCATQTPLENLTPE